ncbi:MAG: hypothetical protein GY809_00175, partial [Planctomycetes bacterium]|nr:hypothetical protein [Planctomycetota bacterium]
LNQSVTRLYVFLADDDADLRASLKTQLDEALYETNVTGELVLPTSEVTTVDRPDLLPAAVLVSPRGRSLVLPMDLPDKTPLQALTELTAQLTRSPFKTNLLAQASRHFAVVLLIESEETLKNRQATLAIETAFMHIAQQMAFMPKRIKSPPVMIKLTPKEAIQHRVLLWELGIEPKDVPAVAIVYGRLRTMGPVLVSEDISEDTLNAYLGVIGADCECDLDRRLLHTPMLAHHWPRSMYEAMTEALAFDPEHPEVKMEVSQIITAHGPVTTGALLVPQVAFGYQEFTVDDSGHTLETTDQSTDRTDAGADEIPEAASVQAPDNERPQERAASEAEPITPSSPWLFYVIVVGVILVTGTLIAWKRR